MSLSPQFLEELRARTSLSSVVGRSLKLAKAGREWKACCPFHKEKTPSFYVNDEKSFWHCFGCGVHGDAIGWLTEARGLPFMDAVKELAEAAGLEVPAADPRAQAKAERSAGLYEVMEAAQRWFEEQLGGIEGAEARAYLEKRAIGDATRRRFGFGYAPDGRNKLRAALASFGNDKLIEAGLLVQPEEEGREPYDRFRGRLTFPIRDRRGRVIAFSARILGAGEPKYLNSPKRRSSTKAGTLFNIDRAAPASRDARRVVVVEGQMDVIALDQAGIGEAVAPLGTAMTETQLALLWQLSPSPLLCFDGDAAGQKASVRAALRALPQVGPGRSLSFVTMPAGQDPDDLVRAGGREAVEALFERPESLVDRLWRHESTAEPLATPSSARVSSAACSITAPPSPTPTSATSIAPSSWPASASSRARSGASGRLIPREAAETPRAAAGPSSRSASPPRPKPRRSAAPAWRAARPRRPRRAAPASRNDRRTCRGDRFARFPRPGRPAPARCDALRRHAARRA
jgi:DNA primase